VGQLSPRKYEEYKGVCFGNGDRALVVDVSLHRVDEDASGLTFDTTATRDGGAWIPAYVRRGSQADSRHGYQEVLFHHNNREKID
jgi:hypothetical protein